MELGVKKCNNCEFRRNDECHYQRDDNGNSEPIPDSWVCDADIFRKKGDIMIAKEMELERECEFYRLRAEESEKAENAFNKVMDIIENAKQRYSDIVFTNPSDTVRIVAQNKWKALDDLQKEVKKLVE